MLCFSYLSLSISPQSIIECHLLRIPNFNLQFITTFLQIPGVITDIILIVLSGLLHFLRENFNAIQPHFDLSCSTYPQRQMSEVSVCIKCSLGHHYRTRWAIQRQRSHFQLLPIEADSTGGPFLFLSVSNQCHCFCRIYPIQTFVHEVK